MDSQDVQIPLIAGWWAKLSDGHTKRIWVNRLGSFYDCRLELCTQEQDEARTRLFDAMNALRQSGQPLESTSSNDARIWSEATFKSIMTSDAAEALEFLGNDDLARTAVAAADAMANLVEASAYPK